MSRGKDTFVWFLFDEIANQLKSGDKPEEDWEPSKLFPPVTAFACVGGSPNVNDVVGSKNVCVSSNVLIDRFELQKRMDSVCPR